jgi:hypothetical protein
VLPHLITILLKTFGTEGCVLIIGALSMHIIVAGFLLKPLKSDENEVQVSSYDNSLYKPAPSTSFSDRRASLDSISDDESEYLETCPIYHDVDTQSIYGLDIILYPLTKSEEILWKDCNFSDF